MGSERFSFPTLDKDVLESALSSPPFIVVEGVINIRDFGGYSSSSGATVKPAYLFRSGEPTRITPAGIDQLRAFGIKKVFDLRAEAEIAKYKTPNAEIEGVDFVRVPILDDAFDPVGMAQR